MPKKSNASMKWIAALGLSMLGYQTDASAQSPHPCEKDARERARKLMIFHVDVAGTEVEIAKTVEILKPLESPANGAQKLDVLGVPGYFDTTEYRMRFIYARSSGKCVLMGQEILEVTGL